MRPYHIFWQGYNHKSGGVRALHSLNNELKKRNVDVSLSMNSVDKKSIVIYPEVIPNNPAKSRQSVHWLLNKAKVNKESMIFAWENGMGNYPLLTVNIIELNIWVPQNVKKKGVAYWIGKGTENFNASLIPYGAVEISRSNFPNRNELASFVAGLDYLISFDPFSALNIEAAICNTPVVIHSSNQKWSKEEIVNHGWTKYGIGWGIDELELAKSTVHKARDHYESLLKIFDNRIDNFIELTQDNW